MFRLPPVDNFLRQVRVDGAVADLLAVAHEEQPHLVQRPPHYGVPHEHDVAWVVKKASVSWPVLIYSPGIGSEYLSGGIDVTHPLCQVRLNISSCYTEVAKVDRLKRQDISDIKGTYKSSSSICCTHCPSSLNLGSAAQGPIGI